MSAFTLVVVAAIVGLVLGAALVPGAPIFALPIVAILIVVLGTAEMRRRAADRQSMESLREKADSDPVQFTERDKQTLAD